MERIKTAIEKAKKSRSEIDQQSSGNAERLKPGYERQNKIKDDLTEIEYRDTRVIKLNHGYLNNKRIIAHSKSNQHSTTFDLLRTQVLREMKANNWKTLAITSPTPEAGKTVVGINLAMSIAHQTEKTALLVDFDLRRPKVLSYLGVDVDVSLNEVFENKAEIKDALINPGIQRFVVLPTKKPIDNSSELLSSKKTDNLINDLKSRYEERIIIFDLPPILNIDDTMAVLPKIDCVIMVVANGNSTKKEITESIQHLGDANLLGVVLNKTDEELKHYYYGTKE